jgi:Carboxypeptidase regulatory-like domain/TonB-dependent Receptor Plug Domain
MNFGGKLVKKQILSLLTMIVLLIAVVSISIAQGTTSRLTGTVTDNNGSVVPGAKVTITNEGTNISNSTQTSDDGSYTFDLIQVGNYSVSVEKTGFKKFVSRNNAVNINQPTTVRVALQTGDVSATVTVESTAEVVQTSSSGNLGTIVDQKSLESLPIFGQRGRNPLDLISFQPGVSTDITNEIGGGVHVHGSRDRAFNFTLDGIDINESSAGGSNFTPLRPNPDSIQEVQIVTSNFTAELGRSSGAQVTFITKSGTNQVRGSLFEYYQTPRLNANEYQNNLNSRPKGQFVQHIFGGSIGGPIIKNKFFYFANLQMLRAYETRLVSRTVLTANARAGLFRYRQGSIANSPAGTTNAIVDSAGNPTRGACATVTSTDCINTYNISANIPAGEAINAVTTGLLRAMPLPNNFAGAVGCTPDGLNTACFNFAAPQRERQYDFVTKFDYKFSDSSVVYVRYAQGQQNTIGDNGNGGLQAFPGLPNKVDTFRDPKNLAINWRWSPTARFTNEFLFGLNKFAFSFNNPDPNYDTNPAFIFNLVTDPFANGAPVINARRLRTNQFVDNVTFDFSPHVIKAGVNFRYGRQIDDRSGVAGIATTLSANFSSTTNAPSGYNTGTQGTMQTPLIVSADLTRLRNWINDLAGRYGTVSRAFVANADGSAFSPAGSKWDFTAFYPEYNFYVQDNWKAKSNLTFDIGLRWEANLNPTAKGRPILRPSLPITLGSSASNSLAWTEGSLYKNDLNNFSPSIGFAWDPFKDGKTSIRANYRLSYDRMNSFVLASAIYQSAPGNTIAVSSSTGGLLANGFPNLVPTTTPTVARTPSAFSASNSITVVDQDLQMPSIHQWSLSFQRELSKNNVLEINYIGNRGVHLFGGFNANQVNIKATDSRCGGQTFLDAFNTLRANNTTTASVCLFNLMFAGSTTDATGTQTFRGLGGISATLAANTPASQTGGGVATAALIASQRNLGTTANGVSTSFLQKFPQFTGGVIVLDSNDYSRYNGLEIIMKRRISSGIGYQFAYTLARSKDTRSFDPTFTTVAAGTGQGAGSTPFDNNNRSLNYSWSDFDRRHSFQGSYTIELPLGKGRKFASDIPSVLDYVIGGWQLAGLVNITSGRPFTIYSGVNTFSNAVSTTANCNGCRRNEGVLIQESDTNFWISADSRSKFSTPNPGEFGNTGRNFFIGPRLLQMDMSLAKRVTLSERFSFDLKLDAKNITNSISFTSPTNVITSSTFGRIRDGVYTSTFARKLQIGIKVNF